mgnify:CR=1 FL=1
MQPRSSLCLMERHEDAAVPFGNRPGDRGDELPRAHVRDDGVAGEPEQPGAVVITGHTHSTVALAKHAEPIMLRDLTASPRLFSESTDRRRQVAHDAGLVARHVTGIRVVEDDGVARAELSGRAHDGDRWTAAAGVAGLIVERALQSIGVELRYAVDDDGIQLFAVAASW